MDTNTGTVIVDNQRLDKFERTLENIVSKLETLVRLEERHDGAVKRIDRHEDRMDGHATRLSALEASQRTNTATTGFIERGAWICFAAIVSAVMYFIRG